MAVSTQEHDFSWITEQAASPAVALALRELLVDLRSLWFESRYRSPKTAFAASVRRAMHKWETRLLAEGLTIAQIQAIEANPADARSALQAALR